MLIWWQRTADPEVAVRLLQQGRELVRMFRHHGHAVDLVFLFRRDAEPLDTESHVR